MMRHLAVFDAILPKIRDACRQVYGDRLVSLVVFGSVARGVPTPTSDIDVLVIGRDLPQGRIPRNQEFEAVEKLLRVPLMSARTEGVDTRFSAVFKTPAEVQVGSPLFLDMTEDGKVLFDRDGFWKQYLAGFSARLRRLGARRVWRGEAWYWDLKPDYRPGEVFEI